MTTLDLALLLGAAASFVLVRLWGVRHGRRVRAQVEQDNELYRSALRELVKSEVRKLSDADMRRLLQKCEQKPELRDELSRLREGKP